MSDSTSAPAAALVLVHGAGSGPWIFDDWPVCFPGVETVAVDLQRDLDVSRAGHDDYVRVVVDAARRLPAPVSLCGWSMGGLVVLQAAGQLEPHSVIALEASPPAEIQGFDLDVAIADGAFDPEGVYGAFPAGMLSRLESSRARAERKRGISVPRLPCPSLVVYGDSFPRERGTALARLYGSDELGFPGLDHWGLVLDPRVRTEVAAWLDGRSERIRTPRAAGPSLCLTCAFVRHVHGRRGQTYLLCRNDAVAARYPRQPVAACTGYERERATPAT